MNLVQILPECVLEDIPLKKALCFRTEKKNTGEVMKFLKDYLIEYEKSYFLFDKQKALKPEKEQDLFKYGRYNLKSKKLIYKCQEKGEREIKPESN